MCSTRHHVSLWMQYVANHVTLFSLWPTLLRHYEFFIELSAARFTMNRGICIIVLHFQRKEAWYSIEGNCKGNLKAGKNCQSSKESQRETRQSETNIIIPFAAIHGIFISIMCFQEITWQLHKLIAAHKGKWKSTAHGYTYTWKKSDSSGPERTGRAKHTCPFSRAPRCSCWLCTMKKVHKLFFFNSMAWMENEFLCLASFLLKWENVSVLACGTYTFTLSGKKS